MDQFLHFERAARQEEYVDHLSFFVCFDFFFFYFFSLAYYIIYSKELNY